MGDYHQGQTGFAASEPLDNVNVDDNHVESNDATDQVNNNFAGQPAQEPVQQPYMSHAARYEWREEYGDIGPPMPELEDELFKSRYRITKGDKFNELLSIKVTTEGSQRPAPIQSFDAAGLHPIMVENIKKSGYTVPTPIQAYSIPTVLAGRDLFAISQTGSGKTAAYMVPTLSKLFGKADKLCGPKPKAFGDDYDRRRDRVRAEPLMLILAPTRELCGQIFDEARRLTYRSKLRPCLVYGGAPALQQREQLEQGCDILVASPGRLLDFLRDTNLISLNRLRFIVIDEADEMLHGDWSEEMTGILKGADANMDAQHQFLLFSATFNKDMRKVAMDYLDSDYVRIRIGRTGSTVRNIKQEVVWVDGHLKNEAVFDLLKAAPPVRTLIFCNSKISVDRLDDYLWNKSLPTTAIHSDIAQGERERSITTFTNGKTPILITTPVSARGLDIPNVMHIINYDLPSMDHGGTDEYIHRIGRTGRLGNVGMATSFYNERDEAMGPFLAKILLENGHQVPDFLEEYKPAEGDELDFEDDSGDEENDPATVNNTNAGVADSVWGNGDSVNTVTAAVEEWTVTDTSSTNNAGW